MPPPPTVICALTFPVKLINQREHLEGKMTHLHLRLDLSGQDDPSDAHVGGTVTHLHLRLDLSIRPLQPHALQERVWGGRGERQRLGPVM